jgi:4-amino-4-deoxy-L-arabinose transferase-like glycosyltransferase
MASLPDNVTIMPIRQDALDPSRFFLAPPFQLQLHGCMMQPAPISSRTRGLRYLTGRSATALLLLLFTLIVRAIGWGPSVINPDESIFSLAAREVLAGHLPYTTMFDNKPVGSTLMLASTFALFGQTVLVTRLVGAACVWASGMLVAALVRFASFSRMEALIAGIIHISFASAIGLGGQATLTETMLLPFTALAALLMQHLLQAASWRMRLLLSAAAGLACGIAVLVKIVPILPGLAIAGTTLLLAWRRHGASLAHAAVLLALFGVMALAPMVVTAGVYAANGVFGEFWWSNFGFAGAYAATHPKLAVVALRLGTAIDTIWPLLLLTSVAMFDAAIAWRRRLPLDDLLLVALAWLAAELVSTAISLQFFPHYFLTAVPPLTVLAAFGIRAFARWTGAGAVWRTALVLGGLIALVAVERTQVDMMRSRQDAPDVALQVAAAIREQAGPAPTLFVTNYKLSGIYLLTRSPLPPTRFPIPAHLFSGQSRMTGGNPRVEVARVLASRPEFIVLDDVEPLPKWAQAAFHAIAREYRPFYQSGTVRVLRLAEPPRR